MLPLAAYSASRLPGVPDDAGCIQLQPSAAAARDYPQHAAKGSAWLRLPTSGGPSAVRAAELDTWAVELRAAAAAAEADALMATNALLRSTLGEAVFAEATQAATGGGGGPNSVVAGGPSLPRFPPSRTPSAGSGAFPPPAQPGRFPPQQPTPQQPMPQQPVALQPMAQQPMPQALTPQVTQAADGQSIGALLEMNRTLSMRLTRG